MKLKKTTQVCGDETLKNDILDFRREITEKGLNEQKKVENGSKKVFQLAFRCTQKLVETHNICRKMRTLFNVSGYLIYMQVEYFKEWSQVPNAVAWYGNMRISPFQPVAFISGIKQFVIS